MKNEQIIGDPAKYHDNPFLNFASTDVPFDEARFFPLMHQRITNKMPRGLCRSILANPTTQAAIINRANRRFMERQHPGAACFQDETRFLMRDHLYWQLGEEMFAVEAPDGWLERKFEKAMDLFFPKRVDRREKMAANLRVEKEVAKFGFARMSLLGAMLKQVINATADEGRHAA
jgi:hypothetical protein